MGDPKALGAELWNYCEAIGDPACGTGGFLPAVEITWGTTSEWVSR